MSFKDFELHDLFPSGEWEGFYCYGDSNEQHKMAVDLFFQNGIVSGSGSDDIATFCWKGNYDLTTFKVSMTKIYPSHQIFYKGDADENGIWGMWENIDDIKKATEMFDRDTIDKHMPSFKFIVKGGFHIWPKGKNKNKNSAEMVGVVESKKLSEMFKKVDSTLEN